MNEIRIRHWQSPTGELIIGSLGDKLCLCDWAMERRRESIDCRICRALDACYTCAPSPTTDRAISQLEEYFAGRRRAFEIDLLMVGTDFQRRVWSWLMGIPYGTTVSYATEARGIGSPKAVRAVAAANAANPISIFVPCHRVIGADGTLTGYGGGLDAKRYLLDLEHPTLFT